MIMLNPDMILIEQKDPLIVMGDFIDFNFETTPESLLMVKAEMKSIIPKGVIMTSHVFFEILINVCEKYMKPKHIGYLDPYTGEIL